MNYLFSAAVAAIRGFAGLVPISSSGHLYLLSEFIPEVYAYINDPALHLFIYIGMTAAILVCTRKTLAKIWKDTFSKRGKKSAAVNLALATFPAAAVLFLDKFINDKITGLLAVGICFMVSAAFMFIADHSAETSADAFSMKPFQAVKAGLFQIPGALCGVSRTGAVLTAAINMGFTRKSAVDFTLLTMIPVMLGRAVTDITRAGFGFDIQSVGMYLTCAAVAALFAFAAIKLVQFLADRDLLIIFTLYCLGIGITTIVLSLIR